MPQHNDRKYASSRIIAIDKDFRYYENELKDYNNKLAWSSACQQLALEAGLTAVTMGVGGAIGRRLASAAVRSESIIIQGRGARTLATLAKASPGVSATSWEAGGLALRLQTTRAACMTLGRLIAAFIQIGGRQVAGQDVTWRTFALGLITAIGIPGPSQAGKVSWTSSGAMNSWQGLNVVAGNAAKAYNQYQAETLAKDKSFLMLVEKKVNFESMINKRADELSKLTIDQAKAHETKLGKAIEEKVRKQNFSSQVPFLARHFSDAPKHVRNYTARLSALSGQYQMWRRVYNGLVYLDHGSKQAKKLLKTAAKAAK